ncbi:tRNA dihydrouridine synthase DusB [Cellulomonas bogoriensis]|uniref:tRNA-dihydrouridine synthase n=1 Tax=Cellulomonas bogoriensis 69B4 = DSM 16987 TaxID=1386082 RepID=A0A0A0C111_9CELL|nr:tRNA dihydrouridine synthase DusB [Cellulomonas bogoriensis]KGM14313.1 tRNA-dihydrouridine synthase [Cellulomonas bogoriensis 69B4 = DSM 16987]
MSEQTSANVLPPLRIGPLTVDTPVVLAPMAGVTNRAFRRLCREHGAGLYVAEMVTSRALVERTPESLRIIRHDEDERPRSVQVYGVDPATVGAAVRMLVDEDRADHVDLNFGCPVPKVTRKGGGAVLPWKRGLFTAIVTAAVQAAAPRGVPVTVKMRKGIDAEHLTYVEAGLIAQDAGVAAVALHARTAADYYSGTADWDAIATLKEAVTDIPVLGNGDIWSAEDAVEMVRRTGCDGVVVGRGCQGRPWLFADLAAAFHGSPVRVRPGMAQVAATVRRHAELMVEDLEDEARALRELRKHMAWYFKGYVVGGELRAQLGLVDSLARLDELLGLLDLEQPYPGAGAEGQRGRAGSPKRPLLPQGWLDSRELGADFERALREAELSVSGG